MATESSADVVVKTYNHMTDPRMLADPFAEFDRLQDELEGMGKRAFLSDAGAFPVWFLLRNEDIRQAFQRTDVFSSKVIFPFQPGGEHEWIPEELDPPDHTKYRRMLNPFMSPPRVAAYEPRMRDWCVSLIEPLLDRDGCEFRADFSRRFPGGAFLDYIGLPLDMLDTFLGWIDDIIEMMYFATPENDPDGSKLRAAEAPVQEYLSSVIAERRVNPRDDFFTYMLNSRVDDRPLTNDEMLNILFLLFIAGLDTTSASLNWMILYLADHPDERARIVNDPSTIDAAIEELLRYNTVNNVGRILTQDTEFAGCPMKKGDRVVLSGIAANRDPDEFPDARTVDFDRKQNRHLAFGGGPHRCAGSHLARLELRVALEEWHKRIPNYHVVDEDKIELHAGGLCGVNQLYLAFDR